MRTNVNLADDARQFAEVYAHANGITLGEAITDLVRKVQSDCDRRIRNAQIWPDRFRFSYLPAEGRIITTEMVLKAQEEDFSERAYLPDVNILIAISDPEHAAHGLATRAAWHRRSEAPDCFCLRSPKLALCAL
jgi:hypothetical protein